MFIYVYFDKKVNFIILNNICIYYYNCYGNKKIKKRAEIELNQIYDLHIFFIRYLRDIVIKQIIEKSLSKYSISNSFMIGCIPLSLKKGKRKIGYKSHLTLSIPVSNYHY